MELQETWLIRIKALFKQCKNRKHKYVKCKCKCSHTLEGGYDQYKTRTARSCGCHSAGKKKNKFGFCNRNQEPVWKENVDGKTFYPYNNFYCYNINEKGNVYPGDPQKILKHTINKKGYHIVSLRNYSDKSNTQIVHRLVASVFIFGQEGLPAVNDKGVDNRNNYANNLEWCTNEYCAEHKLNSYISGKRKKLFSSLVLKKK
ncbi:HNH endonuclease protein [Staphylococcus phage vB_SauH_DELF3]|nr:HNH endonuclease protein [Staphylococcus phage vB_SauH_DELF3]